MKHRVPRRSRIGLISILLIVALAAIDVRAADPINGLEPPSDVAFRSRLDGSEQRYVIQLPKDFDPTKPHDLLIALHGHGADRWQFINDQRDECRAARDAAARHRMIYVSPDYRARTSWMGPAADADLLQILDELHGQFRIANIVISGASMGGTSALAFGAMHPELADGIVAMNGTANLVDYALFQDAIIESYGGSKTAKPDEYRKRSAEFFPERFTMPTALTTGAEDTLVPPESTLRLAETLKQRNASVRLIHQPEGGHQTTYADGTAAFEFVIEKITASNQVKEPLLAFNQQPRKIVCLGDSVTGVYYHTGGQRAYPEMLEIGLRQLFPTSPITVINAGISGNTTADGLNRLDQDVLSKNPDLVTISFGLNDMVRFGPDVFRANLLTLIGKCRERNCRVVLCTPNSVMNTTGRPIDKLTGYCETIRSVGRDLSIPVCDQYQAGERLHVRAPRTWRLTFSDEIHPNMDGHKRMAEELCRTIAAARISLQPVGPPRPSLPHLKSLLEQQKPVRVLAMPPYENIVEPALKSINVNAVVEVTTWSSEGKSIVSLEQEAKATVRSLKPDLVILAVPRDSTAESEEQFIHGYAWIMNWSLSFGHSEWDCVVVHPSVTSPGSSGDRDDLVRRLVRAQHLELVDRNAGDESEPKELFTKWLKARITE